MFDTLVILISLQFFHNFYHDMPQTPSMTCFREHNRNDVFHGPTVVSHNAYWGHVGQAP